MEKSVLIAILLVVLLLPISIAAAAWIIRYWTIPSTDNTWLVTITMRLHAVHDPLIGQYVDNIYYFASSRRPNIFDSIGLSFASEPRTYPLGIGTKEVMLDVTLEIIKDGVPVDSAYKEFNWEVPLMTKAVKNFELEYRKVIPLGDYELKLSSMNAEFIVGGYRVKEVYFTMKLYEYGTVIVKIDKDKTLQEAGIAEPPSESDEKTNISCSFTAKVFEGTRGEVGLGYKPSSAKEPISAKLYIEYYRYEDGTTKKINETVSIPEDGRTVSITAQEGSSAYLRFYKEVGESSFSASGSFRVEDLNGKTVYAVIALKGATVSAYLFIGSDPADEFEARAVVDGKTVSSTTGSSGYAKLTIPWEHIPCRATIEVEYTGTEYPALVGKKLSREIEVDRVMEHQVDFTMSAYAAIAVCAAVGDDYVSAEVNVYRGGELIATNYT
ncbi:MAG: hypothetical protein DRO39_04235, partial [Thermoprotei archaeon]